jgi:hypothetical protein
MLGTKQGRSFSCRNELLPSTITDWSGVQKKQQSDLKMIIVMLTNFIEHTLLEIAETACLLKDMHWDLRNEAGK